MVNYVLQLAGQPHDAAAATEGATVYADNCVACHAEDGTGDRAQGAPDLTDAGFTALGPGDDHPHRA